MQPGKATGPAAFQLPRRSEAVPSHRSQSHGGAAAVLTSRMSPAQGPSPGAPGPSAERRLRSGGGRQGSVRAAERRDGRTDGRTGGSHSYPSRTWDHLCNAARCSVSPSSCPISPRPDLLPFAWGRWSSPAIVRAREMRSCSGRNCRNAPFSSHQKEWIVQTITHRV